MHKLLSHITEHIALYRGLLVMLLLLTAALLLWRPRIYLLILRYATAALCLLLAGWNLFSLMRDRFRERR